MPRAFALSTVLLAWACSDPVRPGTEATRPASTISTEEGVALARRLFLTATTAIVEGMGVAREAPGSTVNVQLDLSYSCHGGGGVQVQGTLLGDVDDASGDGTIDISLSQTLLDCLVDDREELFLVSTDPAVRVTGTLEQPGGGYLPGQRLDMNGRFRWTQNDEPRGSCPLSLVITPPSSSEPGAVRGTICDAELDHPL